MSASALVRKATKAAVLPLGLLEPMRPGDVVILLYHRVGSGSREIDVDASAFRDQMAYLANTGRARDLDEALGGGDGGVVVSVDDGFRDFHESVLPALARYRIPILLYLATGLVEGESHARASDEALTWSQVREAVSTGLVTVGSHTHGHTDLSRATERVAEEEMRRSKELIEDRLGLPCRHFAYPWSVASPEAERAARRHFETAALRWCTNRRTRTDVYRLGRTPVLRSDGHRYFVAKAKGRLDGEATVYRVLRRGPWRRS